VVAVRRRQIAQPHRFRRLRRTLAVQQVADELGEHPQHAEHPDQRRPRADLQEVDVEQRLPCRRPVGLDDDRYRVGDVVDRQDLLGELELRHRSATLRCRGWPSSTCPTSPPTASRPDRSRP
jgi:hypothetical protein